MKMPEDIWIILLGCTYSQENHDNSMSGDLSAEAQKARAWLEENADEILEDA